MMECSSQGEDKLSKLIEGIAKSVQTETKCERADQIRDAVEVHLKTWLDEVEKLNPLFKVSELLQVGSYAEGTKIVQPDEFDFLAVIDDLSQPGSVIIDESASNLEQGLVRVAVADDKVKSTWNQLCEDGHLQCFQRKNFPGLGEERFGHVFISAIRKKKQYGKRLGRFMAGTPIDLSCRIQLPTVNNISLILTGVFYWVPNVLIHFKLGDTKITVDLSPAIRYHIIEDCFKTENCAGPTFSELVLNRKSLLLIGTKHDFDFKVTVTEAEVQYMQSVMKPEHKIIYIFLKYIEKIYKPIEFPDASFTSYMLKTVCIHHDIKCKTEERTVAECFKSVIGELEECARHGHVISVVNKHVAFYLFKSSAFLEKMKRNRKCVHDGLRKLCLLPTLTINTVGDFDAFLKRTFQQENQRGEEEQHHHLIQERDRFNHAGHDTTVVSHQSSVGTEKGPDFQQFDEALVSQIIEMGFEPEAVRKAMRASQNNPEMAIGYLLNGSQKRPDNALTHVGSHSTGTSASAFTALPAQTSMAKDVAEPRQNPSGVLTCLDTTASEQNMDVGEPGQSSFDGLKCLATAASARGIDPAQTLDFGESRQRFPDNLTGVALYDPGKAVYNGQFTGTLVQTSSSEQSMATSELGRSGESLQNPTNEQDKFTCEILYQRQTDL